MIMTPVVLLIAYDVCVYILRVTNIVQFVEQLFKGILNISITEKHKNQLNLNLQLNNKPQRRNLFNEQLVYDKTGMN